ncbi:protein bicaudal C homolog 1-like [Diadema setosum]|uniref:protein bicaudal C homolog 1-like n=1 Tax=Diadema setosum TaxID=31175 RepID=UPI003B3A239A
MNTYGYDPHIKVAGKLFHVAAAKEKIMSVLDTKSNRVTLKMDVSYTEHSHVIGKGGAIIKKVMDDTKCHIHFPDSNRGSQQEKSNQVSIAGQITGVEQARAKIRELLPLVLIFELPISTGPAPSMNSPVIQEIVQTYKVAINMKQRGRGYSTTVTVRGAANNARGMKEGTSRLMEHLIGSVGGSLPVSTQIEISPQHHQFMMGRGGLNIKQISQCTGASIHFPDPNSTQKKSSVFISGAIDSVIVARHLLMGCLPLVLMFDMKDEVEVHTTKLAQLMEQLDIFISIKPKPKQPNKSVIVKSIERNAPNMYRARQILLGQECESCAANASTCPSLGLNGTCLPLHGYNVGTLGLLGQGATRPPLAAPTVLPTVNGLASLNNLNTLQSMITSTPSTPAQWTVQNIPTSLASGMPSQGVTPVLVSPSINPLLLTSPRGSVSLTTNAASNPMATNTTSPLQSATVATMSHAVHPNPSLAPLQSVLQATNQSAPGVPTALPTSPTSGSVQASLQSHINASALSTATALQTNPATSAVQASLHTSNQVSAPYNAQAGLQGNLSTAGVQSGHPRHSVPVSMHSHLQTNPTAAPVQPTPTTQQASMLPPTMLPQSLQATMQQMQSVLNQVQNPQLQLGANPSIPPPPLPHSIFPSATSATSIPETIPEMPNPQTTTPRTPQPPPGFAKPDPAMVTSQLAQLDLNSISSSREFASVCNNNHQLKDLMMHLKSMQPTGVMPDLDTRRAGPQPSQTNLPSQSPRDTSPIDLITTVTPPLGQLGQSALAADMGLDQSSGSSGHSVPRSPTSFVDLVLAQSNSSPSSSLKLQSNNFSPNNSSHDLSGMLGGGRRSLTPDESSVSLFSNNNALNGYGRRSSESGCDSDSSDKRAPGCERRERRLERKLEQEKELEGEDKETASSYGDDYDKKKFLATKAMKKKPVAPEVRVPTDLWSGLGFSKSMPESAIREARRTNGFSLFQRDTNPLPTTYETPNHEESDQGGTSSPPPPPSTSTWPPDRPIQDITPTENNNTYSNPPPGFQQSKKKRATFSDISCSNYIDSGTLPKSSKGLWVASDLNSSLSSQPDLSDIFLNLGLGKYTNVFQQQEIDLSTFLTLTDKDLKELGITTFGARRKMLLAISDLNKTNKESFGPSSSHQGYPSNGLYSGPSEPHPHPTSCW